MRVLKNGGIMLNFDANYGLEDSTDTSLLPKMHAHNMLGSDMMRECDEIKHQLPISSCSRPAWDLQTLETLGVKRIYVIWASAAGFIVKRMNFIILHQCFYCGPKSNLQG